uniref:RING-type domain-containing protein n=1 Tax=viral metagenome TaxID=1070528 RepID=A0A6C0BP81_9ZZZZ
MSITDVCSICIEPFNKSNRKQIICSHCKLECCTCCVRTYLESVIVAPQCMKCHRPWSHQYIRENFGPSFVKKISDVHKSVLFTEQLTLLPYTQEYVNLKERYELLKKEEGVLAEIVNTMKIDISKVKKKYKKDKANKDDLSEIKEEYKKVCNEKTKKMREKYNIIRIMNSSYYYPVRNSHRTEMVSSSSVTSKSKGPQYIKPCGKDECKGYVNKTDSTCELCNTTYCSKCMEENNDNHKCKEEDVLTISMLNKDTKSCPVCATLIHRISGCSDMFCVNCKTAFNWNTLEINKRGNSNPHFYQWLREHRGSVVTPLMNNNDCNRIVGIYEVFRTNNFRRMEDEQQDKVTNILQALHHYESCANSCTALKDYKKTRYDDFHLVTLQHRVDYMRNKLSEVKFKQALLRSNKAREYNNNITEIISSIRDFKQNILQMLAYSDTYSYFTFIQESMNFINYINECVRHIDHVYYNKNKDKDFITIIQV